MADRFLAGAPIRLAGWKKHSDGSRSEAELGPISDDAGASKLTTDRLDLEPLSVAHADEMVGVLSDSILYVFTGGEPLPLEQLRERYRRQIVGRSADETEQWWNWVVRDRSNAAAVGYVQSTMTLADCIADVAWVIGVHDQGRGFAKEASTAMGNWLITQGAVEITAHVAPSHVASNAVARSLGLTPTDAIVDNEVRWSRIVND
jgi:RimJ/RimL family protein N-acetyltransferase